MVNHNMNEITYTHLWLAVEIGGQSIQSNVFAFMESSYSESIINSQMYYILYDANANTVIDCALFGSQYY